MFSHKLAYQDPQRGGAGVVELRGGQWVGDECIFEISATTRALVGEVRLDWRKRTPSILLTDAEDAPFTRELLQKVAEHLAGFFTGAYAGISDAELRDLYGAEYHANQGYSVASEHERVRKGRIAELTIELTNTRKALVAGCSAGECVRQLRSRGVDAYGFDLAEDLASIVYPEVRAFVRRGSLTAIPFGPEDAFDTLTAIDVLEHVPEDRLPQMVAELRRLGVRHLVTLIAHCEFQYVGHVTLRPLHWWEKVLAPHFVRVPNQTLPVAWPVVEAGSSDATKLLRVFRAVTT